MLDQQRLKIIFHVTYSNEVFPSRTLFVCVSPSFLGNKFQLVVWFKVLVIAVMKCSNCEEDLRGKERKTAVPGGGDKTLLGNATEEQEDKMMRNTTGELEEKKMLGNVTGEQEETTTRRNVRYKDNVRK